MSAAWTQDELDAAVKTLRVAVQQRRDLAQAASTGRPGLWFAVGRHAYIDEQPVIDATWRVYAQHVAASDPATVLRECDAWDNVLRLAVMQSRKTWTSDTLVRTVARALNVDLP